MNTDLIIAAFASALAAVAGFFGGNAAVYVFNKIPASWLTDYGEEPSSELMDDSRQRIKSTPWKLIFSGVMIIVGVRFATLDWIFAIAGIVVTWLLIEISIADIKYHIIPDQFVILLAVCGAGFVNFHHSIKDMLLGAALGCAVMLVIALVGRLISGRDALGFGDIKLLTVIGFDLGLAGTLAVIVGMAVISGLFIVVQLVRRKIKRTDAIPLAPFISIAAVLYMLLLWKI